MREFLSGTTAKFIIGGVVASAALAAVVTFAPQFTPEAPAPPTHPPAASSISPPSTDCEDFIFVPCLRQAAIISIPLAGSTFSLTYSSDRISGPTNHVSSGTPQFGLGGWGLNVLYAYDVKNRVLILGNGARRRVDASPVKLRGWSS